MAQESWLIVGLGNPGTKYEDTRHNVGQMVLDELAARVGGSFKSHQSNARVLEGRTAPGAPKLVLAKPNSFMNLSGGPVASLSQYYGVPVERVVVVHDELDLPFDTLKLKQGGGHGGHNGLRDIAKAIDSQNFMRVRVGIGRPPGRQDPADYVLKPFASAEREILQILIGDAADAVEGVVGEGLLATQQRVHGKAGA